MATISRFRIYLLLMTLGSLGVRAAEVNIDLSGVANEPWTFTVGSCLVANGDTFPTGLQNFAGVPFLISPGPNNIWSGCAAANEGPGSVGLTIPVNVYGVTSAFTVINTDWGIPAPISDLYVTFKGSGGARMTVPLLGNVTVRDHNQDGFTNTIDNTSAVQVWDNGLGQRLDRQEYILPAAFATQTLESVTITDTGDELVSRAIVAALTVSTCPGYVAERIAVTSGPLVYFPTFKLYQQEITFTNIGTSAVPGPLYYVTENLPDGVSLANGAGTTSCFVPFGSPYVVGLPAGPPLAPNASVVFRLLFSDPAGNAIAYTPLTLGSLGGRP